MFNRKYIDSFGGPPHVPASYVGKPRVARFDGFHVDRVTETPAGPVSP